MRTTMTHHWRIISLFVLLAFTLVGCGAQSSNNNPTGQITLHLGLCWLHMISAKQTDSLPHQLLAY